MARKYIHDRSITLSIGDLSGRTVKVELWQNGVYSKDLATGITSSSVELHTSQSGAAANHIPDGAGYEIKVVNESDASDYTVLPFAFDMIADNEADVPSMDWPADDGFDFSFNGQCFVESSSGVGSTPSDLYENDPVNGVVGRLSSKVPGNNASIPAYELFQSTSADKPLLRLDSNNRLYAELGGLSRCFDLDIPSAINNPRIIHLIFVGEVWANSLGSDNNFFGSDVVVYEFSGKEFRIGGSSPISTPEINDGLVHVFEIGVSSTAGDSFVRVDGGAKSFGGGAIASISSGVREVLEMTGGSGEGPARAYSFGMRVGEVTGSDYTDWYNYHANHAGLPNI
ncbi:MAG: hypothetical protein ACQES2_05010 [Pseudomonadota bacterium]